MLQVDTATTEGENNTESIQQTLCLQTPSLKECICNEFENKSLSEKIYSTLIQNEINDLDILIFCDENDLNKLCVKLDLSLGNNMKFKALVRKLKNQNQSTTPRQNIVAITNKEQKQINKIESALKRSKNINELLSAHKNEIKQQCTATKSRINQQIISIIQSLQKRQETLNNKVDEWEANKMKEVQNEISNITKFGNDLKGIISNFDDLLTDNKCIIEEREGKIQQIAQQFIKENDNRYKTLMEMEYLRKYILNNTKLSGFEFDLKTGINNIDEFGIIDINVNNDKFEIASILLTDVIKSTEYDQGCKIKLQWDLKSMQKQSDGDDDEKKENEVISDFILKYIECNDDEKENIFDSKWNILENVKIQFISKHNDCYFYIADIDEIFEYKKLYKFKVECAIKKPMELLIESNIESFKYEKKSKLVNIDMNKQKEIELKIHSYHGHYGDEWKPENVLKSDNTYYCSQKDVICDDWIIFDLIMDDNNNENIYFYPITIKLRTWNGNASIQQFNFYVGNVDNNEWIKCNEDIFISDRSRGKEWQIFNLDIVKSNNIDDEINKKWQQIGNHRYHHLKLQLLNNYGNSSYIGFYGLKIFAVQSTKE